MQKKLYYVSYLFAYLSLLACHPTTSVQAPITKESQTALATAQPSQTPSPKPSVSPSSAPSASTLEDLKPIYIESARIGIDSHLMLVSAMGAPQLAWKDRVGKLKLFNGESARDIGSNYKYTLVYSIFGFIGSNGQGLLVAKDSQRGSDTGALGASNSRAIQLNTLPKAEDYPFDRLQVRAVGLNEEGNGYILFSDEYPQTGVFTNLPNVKLYTSKVQNFVPGPQELLVETKFINQSGGSVTSPASINPDGSGFYTYGRFFQAFSLNGNDASSQKITESDDIRGFSYKNDKYLVSLETDLVQSTSRKGTVITKRTPLLVKVRPVTNNQPPDKTYSYPLPHKITTGIGKTEYGDYRIDLYDIALDESGNGLLVSVKQDKVAMNDVLVIQAIKQFEAQAAQEYIYPNHQSIVDLKLLLDSQGNGKLALLEGKCSDKERCGSFNPEENSLRLAYLAIQQFTLKQ